MGYRYGVRYRPMRHFPTSTTRSVIVASQVQRGGTLGEAFRSVKQKGPIFMA